MITSREFLDLVLDQMADFGCVTARRMFGGVGIYRNGVMFALIADDVLYLKAAPSNIQDFDAEDLEPFTYRTGGGKKAVMSYRRAPFRCLEDEDSMTEWCRKAFAAACEGPDRRRARMRQSGSR